MCLDSSQQPSSYRPVGAQPESSHTTEGAPLVWRPSTARGHYAVTTMKQKCLRCARASTTQPCKVSLRLYGNQEVSTACESCRRLHVKCQLSGKSKDWLNHFNRTGKEDWDGPSTTLATPIAPTPTASSEETAPSSDPAHQDQGPIEWQGSLRQDAIAELSVGCSSCQSSGRKLSSRCSNCRDPRSSCDFSGRPIKDIEEYQITGVKHWLNTTSDVGANKSNDHLKSLNDPYDSHLIGVEYTSPEVDKDLSAFLDTIPEGTFMELPNEAFMEIPMPVGEPSSEVGTAANTDNLQEWTQMQDILYGLGEDRPVNYLIPFAPEYPLQAAQQASDPTSPLPHNQAQMSTEHREDAQVQHEPPHAEARPVWHKMGDLLRNPR